MDEFQLEFLVTDANILFLFICIAFKTITKTKNTCKAHSIASLSKLVERAQLRKSVGERRERKRPNG